MPDPTITNVDLGNVLIRDAEFVDAEITFGGADTYVEGTILALDSGTLKWIAFVKGGVTADNGIPKGILTYDVVATGAGDLTNRIAVKGTFNFGRVVIDADGDNSAVDAAVKSELQDFGIILIPVQELNILDNQ